MAEPDASEREDDQRGGFVKSWTTLPGVLTGVAAVITAVVSLVAVFASKRRPRRDGSGTRVRRCPWARRSIGGLHHGLVREHGSRGCLHDADGRVRRLR